VIIPWRWRAKCERSRKEENTTYTTLPFRDLATTYRREILHCILVIIIPEKFHTTLIKRKVTNISEFAKIRSLNYLTITPSPQTNPTELAVQLRYVCPDMGTRELPSRFVWHLINSSYPNVKKPGSNRWDITSQKTRILTSITYRTSNFPPH
jgi:hypothetical protein